jgi:transcriptional regulator with XRE-family HTH domain
MAVWRDELRINEAWLFEAVGEVFEYPFGKNLDRAANVKKARVHAGLSLEEVSEWLNARTTARMTAKELAAVESGKIIITRSLQIGLAAALRMDSKALFPETEEKPQSLKESLADVRSAAESLTAKLRDLENRIGKEDSSL